MEGLGQNAGFCPESMTIMPLQNEGVEKNSREQLYQVFNWLRFPLMVLVVFVHVTGPSAVLNADLAGIGYYDLFRRALSLVLAQLAVPMFFFISGYLFLNRLQNWDWGIYSGKLKKRCKSLLLPYVVWNTIGILVVCFALYRQGAVNEIRHLLLGADSWKLYWCSRIWAGPSDWLGVTHAVTSPCLQPLWFLRDLMVVMVLSPLLWALFRYTRVWGLLLLLLGYLSQCLPVVPGITPASLFFFGTGMYMNMNNIDPSRWTWRYRYVFHAVTLLLFIVTMMCVGYDANGRPMISMVNPFFVVFGCISTMNVATAIVKTGHRVPELLSSSAFFIFVSHALLLETSNQLTKFIFGSGNALMLTLRYLFTAFIAIATCVLCYWLLRKFAPRLCGFLTGQR